MMNEDIKPEKTGRKAAVTGCLPYIEFTEDNNITYYQDFGWKRPLPHGVKFYPDKIDEKSIWFIGDRHGIIEGNKYGLTGKYGNGSINVDIKDLPVDVVEFCRANCR